MRDNWSILQKLLMASLYGLLALMILFSIMAMGDKGEAGYDSCIQEKCELKGEDYCNKYRERNNCCLGAGGSMGVANGQYVCSF